MKALHLAMAFALTLATAGAAQAQDTPAADPEAPATPPAGASTRAFGNVGQIVISGELQAGFLHTTLTPGSESADVFVLQPAADFFVAPNLSLGGFLTLAYTSSTGTGRPSSTVVGIAARLGYNLAISSAMTIWLTASLGYAHTSANSGGYLVPLEIFAPMLFHIADHLFIGLGPLFRTDLVSKGGSMNGGKQTDLGVLSVVGGYFGG